MSLEKKFYKFIIALFVFNCFLTNVFSQSIFNLYNQQEEIPNLSDQRQIIIIDSLMDYDLDPHTANYSNEAQILLGVYEGLFSYDPVTQEPLNALCESYKISRDKKKWTFNIRKDAKFSDGKKITAQTVKSSWIKLLSNPYASFASMLDCVSGARNFRLKQGDEALVGLEVKDEYTLVVKLEKPCSYFPKILCHSSFCAIDEDLNNYSGAFYIESYENYILTLKKNPNYWGKDGVIIPGITFIQSDNEDANAYDFNQGKADWVKANTSVAKILNPQNLYIAAVFGTSFLFFKQNNFPWNITEFRQALLEALPYDELRKNYSVKAKTFIYPLTGYPKVEGIEDYDLDFAKELMSEARKKNGISQTEKIKLVFGISQEKYMYDLAEQLKKAWEPLGVELVTQATPSNRYANSIEAWNADLFSYSWIGDFADPMAFLEMYRSTSSLNVSGFKNDEFDKMLLDSDLETNEYSRYEILSKAEQFLLNQNVIIPLAHSIEVHLIDLNVIGGWTTNALDIHPLKNLYIKPPKCTVPNLVMLD